VTIGLAGEHQTVAGVESHVELLVEDTPNADSDSEEEPRTVADLGEAHHTGLPVVVDSRPVEGTD
jgi:hypothetical protein